MSSPKSLPETAVSPKDFHHFINSYLPSGVNYGVNTLTSITRNLWWINKKFSGLTGKEVVSYQKPSGLLALG
jgi:hypothetical protein